MIAILKPAQTNLSFCNLEEHVHTHVHSLKSVSVDGTSKQNDLTVSIYLYPTDHDCCLFTSSKTLPPPYRLLHTTPTLTPSDPNPRTRLGRAEPIRPSPGFGGSRNPKLTHFHFFFLFYHFVLSSTLWKEKFDASFLVLIYASYQKLFINRKGFPILGWKITVKVCYLSS